MCSVESDRSNMFMEEAFKTTADSDNSECSVLSLAMLWLEFMPFLQVQ